MLDSAPPDAFEALPPSGAAGAADGAGSRPPGTERHEVVLPPVNRMSISVEPAVFGKGLVNPFTYFAIRVNCDLRTVAQAPPAAASAAAGGGRRATLIWFEKSRTMRRYSELVLLRQYLSLKHLGCVIPALPEKSTAQSLNTSLCSESELFNQQHQILNFLEALTRMAKIVDEDTLVMQFLQAPRIDNDWEESRVGSLPVFAEVLAAVTGAVRMRMADLDIVPPASVSTGVVRYVASWIVPPPKSTVDEAKVKRILSECREYQAVQRYGERLKAFRQGLATASEAQRVVVSDERELFTDTNDALVSMAQFEAAFSSPADDDLRLLVHQVRDALGPAMDSLAKRSLEQELLLSRRLAYEVQQTDAAAETVEQVAAAFERWARVEADTNTKITADVKARKRAEVLFFYEQLTRDMQRVQVERAHLFGHLERNKAKVLSMTAAQAVFQVGQSAFGSVYLTPPPPPPPVSGGR